MLQAVFGKTTTQTNNLVPAALKPQVADASVAYAVQPRRFLARAAAFSAKYPSAKLIFAGLGAVSLFLGFNYQAQARKSEIQIQQRKEKLALPPIVLSGADSQNPPINEKNINDWLYKTITIAGRPIHAKQMLIPTISYGLEGYELLVPFVTKENEDGTVQEGLLLNLGFIPKGYAPIYKRSRIENAEQQVFTCVVTEGKHLSEQGGLFASNNVAKNEWEYANLDQLAQHTGFVNKEQTRCCILESVNPNTYNDERDCRLIDICSDYKEDYPYKFTRSGILYQPGQMPWHLNQASQNYSLLGLASVAASALLFVAK